MNSTAHPHHHEAGHSCVVPDPSPDRAAELSRLRFLATKVSNVHGRTHPAMVKLAEIVSRTAATPLLPIAPEDRADLTLLTAGYAPWPTACGSVRALFDGLKHLPNEPA